MDKSMDRSIIMDKLSHKTDRFQEKLSPPRHNSLHNEDLKQTRVTHTTIRILLRERERRSQERVMNVEGKRYLVLSLLERALQLSWTCY